MNQRGHNEGDVLGRDHNDADVFGRGHNEAVILRRDRNKIVILVRDHSRAEGSQRNRQAGSLRDAACSSEVPRSCLEASRQDFDSMLSAAHVAAFWICWTLPRCPSLLGA
jgi:hypothetical protein